MRTEPPHGSDPPQRHPDDSWPLAEPLPVRAGTRRALSALIDAMVPPNPRRPGTVSDIADQVLRLLRYMPRSTVYTFTLGLHVLNWSPLWRLRGLLPLSRLDRPRALRHLRTMANSRWLPARLLMLGPQGLILSSYFDQDYAHDAISYEPRGFITSRIRLRRQWLGGAEPDDSAEIHYRPEGHP